MKEAKKRQKVASDEIWWRVMMAPGIYGLYDYEVSRETPEVKRKRRRGVRVKAQTDFFARQRGAIAMALAPEHVTAVRWQPKERRQ